MHHRRPGLGDVVDGHGVAALATDEQEVLLAEARRGDTLRLNTFVFRPVFRVVTGADEGVLHRDTGVVPDLAVVVEQGKSSTAAFITVRILIVALVGGRQQGAHPGDGVRFAAFALEHTDRLDAVVFLYVDAFEIHLAGTEVTQNATAAQVNEHDVVVLLQGDGRDVLIIDAHVLRLRIVRRDLSQAG